MPINSKVIIKIMKSKEQHLIRSVYLIHCKPVEGYTATACRGTSCLSFSPAKTPKANLKNCIILRK